MKTLALNKRTLRLARRTRSHELGELIEKLRALENHKAGSLTLRLDVSATNLKKTIRVRNLQMAVGVYVILSPTGRTQEYIDALKRFRVKQKSLPSAKKQAVPRPNENQSPHCLYVGRIRKGNLERRMLEHFLGTKSPKTGALKLSRWVPRTLRAAPLRVEYIIFDGSEGALIAEVETALWNHLQPAAGEL